MSITSRINEMSSHIEQAYDELQGLGADLTNVNKNIENISMVLDDIYDSMPQVSGEGTSLTLDDTRVGKIKSTLKGNTSQTGTPTPTTPIPVNVVSGDNEIQVCGKNLLNIPNNTITGTGYTFTTNNGLISITTTETNNSFDIIGGTRTGQWVPSYSNANDYHITQANMGTYKISFPNISANINTGNQEFDIMTNQRKLSYTISKTGGISGTTTFTLEENEYVKSIYIWTTASSTITNLQFNLQLEKGTSSTDYEPYQGNTYNIDLPSGMELCKIGNYQDYFYKDSDKWYLHKEIGKVVLDGSEDGWSYPSANRFNLDGIIEYLKAINTKQYYSNNYEAYDQKSTNGDFNSLVANVNYGFDLSSGSSYTIRIKDTRYTSLDDFKTYLSNNNVVVYYVLATPVNTALEDM